MNVFSIFKGEYLSATELGEKKPTLVISRVNVAKVEDDKGKARDRPILFFSGVERGLVLCKTNALLLSAMFSEETDAWTGKKVTIHSEMVQVGPERKLGVRIYGSPDISKEVKVSIKLPKRKAFIVTLVPTGKAAQVSVTETPAKTPENTQENVTA